jgi:cephalosporin-C deacetylase-like acetyl esterase
MDSDYSVIEGRKSQPKATDGTLYDITYTSPQGGPVGAYLVIPEGKRTFAGILFGTGEMARDSGDYSPGRRLDGYKIKAPFS